jgi:hypothetical protein
MSCWDEENRKSFSVLLSSCAQYSIRSTSFLYLPTFRFQSHPGNQKMLELVDAYRVRYFKAERKGKHVIVEEVMRVIRGSGGRFLSRVDYENYWVEVTHAIAYRKVGHAFRSKARSLDKSSKTSFSKRPKLPPSRMLHDVGPSALPDYQSLILGPRAHMGASSSQWLANSQMLPGMSSAAALPYSVRNQSPKIRMPGDLPLLYGQGTSSFLGGGVNSQDALLQQRLLGQRDAMRYQQRLLGGSGLNMGGNSLMGGGGLSADAFLRSEMALQSRLANNPEMAHAMALQAYGAPSDANGLGMHRQYPPPGTFF